MPNRPWTLVSLAVFSSLPLSLGACKGSHGGAPSASASAAAASAPPPIVLRSYPSRIGDRWKETKKSTLSMSVEFWQESEKLGSNELSRNEEYDRTTEVLGLVGGAPAKVRVHYDHYRDSEVRFDKPPRQDAHLEGQTYVLDATDGPAKVTSPDGKPVLDEERESLVKLHGELGGEDPIAEVLSGKKLVVGHTLPMRKSLFKALTGGAGELKEGTLTPRGTRTEAGREAAVFDWTAEMHTQEDNGLEIDWHMKGELVIGLAPAVTLSAKITSSLDASGRTRKDGRVITLAGAGKMQDDRVMTPL